MKKLLFGFLFSSILLFACRNGETKKVSTNPESVEKIEQLEQESEIMEETVNEIKQKEAALEKALKELE